MNASFLAILSDSKHPATNSKRVSIGIVISTGLMGQISNLRYAYVFDNDGICSWIAVIDMFLCAV